MKVVSKNISPTKKISSSQVNKIIKKVVANKKILARKTKIVPQIPKIETKIKTKRTRSKKEEKVINLPELEEVVVMPMILTEEPSVASDYYETLPGFITSPIISTSIDIAPQTEIHDTHSHDTNTQSAVLERVELATTYTEPIESIFTELEQILSKESASADRPALAPAQKAHILKRLAIGFLHIFTKFAKRYPQETN
ncbi:MAG: hypothetical protein M3Q73_03720 [bacterium]|nr:hypothetical protein [bacterium]